MLIFFNKKALSYLCPTQLKQVTQVKKYYKYKTIPGIVYTIRQVTAKQDEWQRILPKPAANPYLNDHLALVKALQFGYMIEMTAREIQELQL